MKKEFEDTKTKQGRKKGRGKKKEQDEVSGENLNEEFDLTEWEPFTRRLWT